MTALRWIAGAGLVGVAAILLFFWVAQRRLIYFPSADVGEPAAAGVPEAERVVLSTRDGLRLGAWFVPSSPPANRGVVIVFNGNAGNRSYRADLARGFRARGLATLLFDYRGYGGNPGSPSEEGLALDAIAAREYLDSRQDVDRGRIVYFGESLGSAVAVRLALTHPPAALVLRSPFTSLADTAVITFPTFRSDCCCGIALRHATRSRASGVRWS